MQSVAIIAVYGLINWESIDNLGHAGGFVAGLLLSFIIRPLAIVIRPQSKIKDNADNFWLITSILIFILFIASETMVWHGIARGDGKKMQMQLERHQNKR